MRELTKVLANVGRRIGCICFIGVLSLHGAQNEKLEASKTVGLSQKKVTISIGKQKSASFTIENKVKGATYSYKSSNKKIVKVSKQGILTGVKSGTAKIIVKQKKKKKVKKIGTVKVTVKNAIFDKKNFIKKYGTVGTEMEFYPLEFIKYQNENDEIYMESDNTDVVDIWDEVATTGEEGVANITIYNGDEVLATVSVTVKYKKLTQVAVSTNKVDIYMGATVEECSKYFTVDALTEGVDLSKCEIQVLNEDICYVNYDFESSNEVEVIGGEQGNTTIAITNLEGEILQTIPVMVIDAMDTVISRVQLSTNSLFVDMDAEENSFYFNVIPEYGYADNCTVEAENLDICDVYMEVDEEDPSKAYVQVTGGAYGITNIYIRNQNEEIIETLPVVVADSQYKVPKSVSVDHTSVKIEEGDYGEVTYVVHSGKADYCMVEVANEEICTITNTTDESTGTIEITAESIGTTKIYIKNFEGTILKTITVKVVEIKEE
ncbi:MAG: hypothetical protein II992_07235 [Lachnospiraceae bacterium]|nr:hypothetical protein [Lachnospiraceae bacterium]